MPNRRQFVFLAFIALCRQLIARAKTTQKSRKTSPEARVDINVASFDELLKVPGMTRVWADRIIRFRPYRTKGDLLEHGVLNRAVYDRVKDYLIAHREKE